MSVRPRVFEVSPIYDTDCVIVDVKTETNMWDWDGEKLVGPDGRELTFSTVEEMNDSALRAWFPQDATEALWVFVEQYGETLDTRTKGDGAPIEKPESRKIMDAMKRAKGLGDATVITEFVNGQLKHSSINRHAGQVR